ncbi:MAG: type II secretion system F family protein [Candidatus Doudnabacteria bacterium]|nr:type II secretion system F family protein [Candidatus Doudnabacteria bacterium]
MQTLFSKIQDWFGNFTVKERITFCKRLSFMVGSGIPIWQSMNLLYSQAAKGRRKTVVGRLLKDISAGHFLYTAFEKHMPELGEYGINIIKVGELSGTLGQNLDYLSAELKKKYELQKKVLSAMFYPAFIVLATFFMVMVLTVYVFPKVLPIFTSLNMGLPLSTRALMYFSKFLISHGVWVFLLLCAIFSTLFIAYRKSLKLRTLFETVWLNLPVVGKIYKYYLISQICRTLGVLLKTGMRLDEALVICRATSASVVYKNSLSLLHRFVVKGGKVSDYFVSQKRLFGGALADMVGVGEASGTLSDTMLYVSDMYETDLEDLAKNLSSALEPALIVLMGLMVGFVAVSIITPIYSVTQKLKP